MKYPSPLIQAVFIERENRFCARVKLDGKIIPVHVPNSGRLKELLTEGNRVFITPAGDSNPKRKTGYTLILAAHKTEENLVCVHSVNANDLFEEAINGGIIKELNGYTVAAREKTIGKSRMDFILKDPAGKDVYTEIKSVSLAQGDKALFPDAPTERGSKHLKELIRLKQEGLESAVVFIIQRQDVKSFSPYDQQDPIFGSLLREACKTGVRILAYRCIVNQFEIKVDAKVPVIL
jgi:sugar fermentation stimulation protein A